jgi:hypothetical protein
MLPLHARYRRHDLSPAKAENGCAPHGGACDIELSQPHRKRPGKLQGRKLAYASLS